MKELVTIDQLKEYDKKKSEKIILQSEKGEPNGVATLDESGKIPIEQVNIKAMCCIGTYDCSSGIFPSTENRRPGDFYRVSVGGVLTEMRDDIIIFKEEAISNFEVELINKAISTGLEVFYGDKQVASVENYKVLFKDNSFLSLPTSTNTRLFSNVEFPFSWDFDVGDFILYNDNGEWQKLDNNDAVSSVNGKTGVVDLVGTDIKITEDGSDLKTYIEEIVKELKVEINKGFENLTKTLIESRNHNIPRNTPKDITSYITDGTLWQRLNGTNGFSLFEDIFVGDYIKMSRPITVQGSNDNTVGSQYVMIAGIDTLQNNGDTVVKYHHLVMVPGGGANYEYSQHFGRRRMNASDTTAGGYVGSEMYTTHIGAVTTSGNVNGNINQQLYAEFGSHLKTTRELLTNSVNMGGGNRITPWSGGSDGWGWYNCQAVLMSEIECYGSIVSSSSGRDTGNANHWLPLFQFSEIARNNRSAYYWLKDVASASYFCCSDNDGRSTYNAANSNNYFVRPRFVIA